MFRKMIALTTLSVLMTSGALLAKPTQAQPLVSSPGYEQSYDRPTLHVDNWTGDWVRIYVDGDYVGRVSPYGDLYIEVSADEHILRGVDADGGTFGPRYIDLSDGSDFHWTLTNAQ
ncbi:MAG TPA: hypothetical protein VKT32_02940 [Chthonomonadaceae bacterium]|nr:hypothetical protein [Chthonomonadaceae bacterium]